MCGRYLGPESTPEQWAAYDRLIYESRLAREMPRNYNIGPEQQAPVLFHEGDHAVVDLMLWGWHPAFKKGGVQVNAHAETAHWKQTFAASFRERRCILPTGGFYEWKKTAEGKLPFLFTVADARETYIAGLWLTEQWKDVERQRFIVLTTAPNALVAQVHDRMAMILDPVDAVAWIDPAADEAALRTLCRPYPAERMTMRALSPLLNSVKNKGPEVLTN